MVADYSGFTHCVYGVRCHMARWVYKRVVRARPVSRVLHVSVALSRNWDSLITFCASHVIYVWHMSKQNLFLVFKVTGFVPEKNVAALWCRLIPSGRKNWNWRELVTSPGHQRKTKVNSAGGVQRTGNSRFLFVRASAEIAHSYDAVATAFPRRLTVTGGS